MRISLANSLTRRLSQVRKEGIIDYLRPDGKSQVTVRYEGHRPVAVDTVLIGAQHKEGAEEHIKGDLIQSVIEPVMPDGLFDSDSTELLVSPTDRRVVDGPRGDAGLTGGQMSGDTYRGPASPGR